MRKRLTALALVLVLLVSLLPMPAAATGATERDQIKAIVEGVIKGYAKKVGRSSAAEDAFSDFFYHSFFGNGRKLNLTEQDALIQTAFASNWLPVVLTEGITEAIIEMGRVGEDSLYLRGSADWKTNATLVGLEGITDTKKNFNAYLTTVINTKDIFGVDDYKCATNSCDEMLCTLVGNMLVTFLVRRVQVKEHSAVYQIDLTLEDSFNFEKKDYQELQKKGINTVKDEVLNYYGYLLTFMGLDSFEWGFKKSLTVEVSFDCDHNGDASYGWSYDEETQQITSYDGDGYTENTVTRHSYSSAGVEFHYYYELEDTVTLRYDMPWVVEVEQTGLGQVVLSPLKKYSNALPILYSPNQFYYWIAQREFISNGTEYTISSVYYEDHFVGAKSSGKVQYDADHRYLQRYENRIEASGENMIYVSVYDMTADRMYLESTPMTTEWLRPKSAAERVLQSQPSNMVSGQDLYINYIGNQAQALKTKEMDIRIHENGENVGTYKAPTCTDVGGYQETCRDCGYVFIRDIEPALGHSYGEYMDDDPASCVTDGTKTAVCSRCGDKDTVTVPDTALGHSYGEYVFDNNAGCVTDATETATCSACGDKTTRTVAGTAKGHNYISVTVKPTCTEVGYRNHLCRCGDEYRTDEVPALGHTPVTDAAVAATCITKGLTEGSHCEVCNAIIVAQQETATVGHTWDKGTITVQPTPDRGGTIMYTCIHCGVKDYFSIQYTERVQFQDVSDDDYFADAVAWAAEKNITTGIGEGLFGPNQGCTRGQVVTFLWRAAGEPMPKNVENPFNDVSENDFFYTAVLWAVENGITTGAGEGRFDPDSTCTRGQIVTFLWRSFGKEAANSENPFADVGSDAYFYDAVLWAVDHGITTGVNSEKFAPDANCTRGQVVTFLHRGYN